MVYELLREQFLECSLDEAWQFFSSPYNLPRIAPSEMDFKIVSNLETDKIYEGLKIDYTVRPLFHIKLNWKSEIRGYQFRHSFIDYQLKRPYKFWSHYHEFIPSDNGVLMQDVLKYEITFGIFGDFINYVIIKKENKILIFNDTKAFLDVISLIFPLPDYTLELCQSLENILQITERFSP